LILKRPPSVVELNIRHPLGSYAAAAGRQFATSFAAENGRTARWRPRWRRQRSIRPAWKVVTGSGSQYIDFAGRRIHASANGVKVNVAEFVYVTGNFALDMGSRESVTIRTGIPSNVGALAADVLDDVNELLDGLGARSRA
jgi:hypothetical protein